MTAQKRVQVFVDSEGRYGSPLLVVPDSAGLDDPACQAIAAASGTSETVFVDDAAGGRVRIFVPAGRIPFAGYPLLGAGWLLRSWGYDHSHLVTDAGPVALAATDDGSSIRTAPGRGNPWRLIEVSSPRELASLTSDGDGRHDYAWAWLDQEAGKVRARAFTSASGRSEDEATGAAAIELCAHLGRDLRILQGRGSVLRAEFAGSQVRLSGAVRRFIPSRGPRA